MGGPPSAMATSALDFRERAKRISRGVATNVGGPTCAADATPGSKTGAVPQAPRARPRSTQPRHKCFAWLAGARTMGAGGVSREGDAVHERGFVSGSVDR